MSKQLNALTANIGDIALKRRVVRIISRLALQERDVVLDCGCGDGLYLKIIRELGNYKIIGFDLNDDSLKLAQDISGKSVPFVQGDITRLPFEDSCFDKIFSTEVLEHLTDDSSGLKEIYRVLKPGGKLIVTVPNHNYPFLWDPLNWVSERLSGKHIKSGLFAGIWNMHLRLYYPNEIESLVEKSGFKVEAVELLTHYCVPFNHILLYALKQVLNSGVLPQAMRNSADKFSAGKGKQSILIKSGYKFLNFINRFNDRITSGKSSVAILVDATKP